MNAILNWLKGLIHREQKAAPTSPTQDSTSGQSEIKREYTQRGVFLPSGRFAGMSKILWIDIVLSADNDALWRLSKLAVRCVAVDDVPLTPLDLLTMDASEMLPIMMMVSQENVEVTEKAKGAMPWS